MTPGLNIACLRIAWRGETTGPTMAPFRLLSVDPAPAYPFGRKGLLIASAWDHLKVAAKDGLLLWDGDVAMDPLDFKAMLTAAGKERDAVHTAPVRIWPRSTHLTAWVWGHRKSVPPEWPAARKMAVWQEDCDDPEWFTFGLTFLPGALLDACRDKGMDTWCFPSVDTQVREVAKSLGMPVRVVRDCHPVHLNF